MDIVVALIGAVATIAAAVISVRAARRPAPSTDALRAAADAPISDLAPFESAPPTATGLGGGAVAVRLFGAFGAFMLSALAFATLLNAGHDVSTGEMPLNPAAVVVVIVILVMMVAVFWNLARLLIRPIGMRTPLRSTLLLAANVVTFGLVLAMMAGQW